MFEFTRDCFIGVNKIDNLRIKYFELVKLLTSEDLSQNSILKLEMVLERLSEYAGSLSEDQMAVFIELADRLVADVESAERFCLNEGVSQIVNKVCIDRSKALKIFLLLMKNGHHLEVVPAKMLQTLFDFTLPIEIWRVIQEYSFPQKNTWEYWFFQMLPENKINEELYSLMIEYLEEDTDKLLKSSPYRNMRFLDKFTTIHSEVYVSAARIIFRKREYSSFIVSIYFSLLFHENTYTPQELKRFFETDLELLRDIYMWMASYDSTFDYKGSFLAEYITIDDSWINAYATICSDIIMNDCDRDHHQINVPVSPDIAPDPRTLFRGRKQIAALVLYLCTQKQSSLHERH